MLRALPYYMLFGLCVFLMGFYVGNYQPQFLTDALMVVDVFGWTPMVEAEKNRLYKINELTIPYEEKQVLVNRTVFMGATTSMVELALGKPLHRDDKDLHFVYYVYYLPEDKRPTIFKFQDDKLIDAYKGSALDVR